MLALPCYTALGSTVKEDADRFSSALTALKDEGWELLGDGYDCTALLSPDGERVLKIFDRSSGGPGALYSAASRLTDNPHLPRIYGRLDLDNGGFAVECERLNHIKFTDWRKWFDAWRVGSLDKKPEGPMKDAMRALTEAKDEFGCAWDTHLSNIMRRPSDGALVLNDPLV